jgi:hypothetical protein
MKVMRGSDLHIYIAEAPENFRKCGADLVRCKTYLQCILNLSSVFVIYYGDSGR